MMINRRTLLWALVLSSRIAGRQTVAQNCETFDCLNNSTCADSSADFSDHPDGLEFQKEVERDGKHCACPYGFTGLRCGTPFENCNDGMHKCYNGGKCIPGLEDIYGNDQMYCDCNEATDLDGIRYAGKYCEHAAMAVCDDADDVFCVNGGTCKEDFRNSPQRPCRCHDPTRDGPHCEFTVGQVPACDLDCENGGHCVLGIQTVEDARREFKDLWRSASTDAMYCECPDGFGGPTCEASLQPCGDQVCFHGSKCVTANGGEDEDTSYCDCTEADGQFAGRYCEFEATETCRTKDHVDGTQFCVNGGSCSMSGDDAEAGGPPTCRCPLGFYGPMCEFVIPEDTDDDDDAYTDDGYEQYRWDSSAYRECDQLKCKNGGTCRKGAKDISIIEKFARDHGNSSLSSSLMHLERYDDSFEHCICPEGFMGLDCSQEVEYCGKDNDKDVLCFFGSECIRDARGKAMECSCVAAQKSNKNYAGKFCQHEHTSICTRDGAPNGVAFCVNEGACLKHVDYDDEHPGCKCKPGFSGHHCELAASVPPNAENTRTPHNASNTKGGIVTGVMIAVVFVVVGAACVVKRKRQTAKEIDSVTSAHMSDMSSHGDTNLAPAAIHHSFTADGPVIMGDDGPMTNVEII